MKKTEIQQELPLVSIVTPSLNQGAFIEETILSVKNQTYPRIEHIITDGGSTDNTLDIIKKYEGTYNMRWISEPDQGQSDAINKGWRLSQGEVLAYLNSDDTYMPPAVEMAVKSLTENPDASMVYGDCVYINERSEKIRHFKAGEFDLKKMLGGDSNIPQPTVFFKKEVLNDIGYLDTSLQWSMDFDMWVRIGLKYKIEYIPQAIATMRLYQEAKSSSYNYNIVYDHLSTLDKVFPNSELPKELKALKRRSYSRVHLRGGFIYQSLGQMRKARKHLIKALIWYPQNFTNPGLLGYLIASFFGKRATEAIVRLGRKR